MRKNKFFLLLAVMAVSVALIASGCRDNGNEKPSDGSLDGTIVEEPSDGSDTQDENKDKEGKKSEEKNRSGEQTSKPPVKDPNAPATGDDKSVRGIPDPIEVRTCDDGDLLVLVNKYYNVSKDYEPSDMVTINNKYGTYTDYGSLTDYDKK